MRFNHHSPLLLAVIINILSLSLIKTIKQVCYFDDTKTLASYGLDTEVWMTISNANMLAMGELL